MKAIVRHVARRASSFVSVNDINGSVPVAIRIGVVKRSAESSWNAVTTCVNWSVMSANVRHVR